ncbi:hypothetical protein CsSME_00025123 [Camellia sinensis var. sinensis]
MWQNLKDLYYSKCGFNPGPFTLEYSSTWENQFVVKNYWRPLLVYGTWDNIIEIMGDEDLMWLSYWKFENQLEGGDELNISVVGNEDFQVKKFGVHLVYKEQEEKSSQSTSEEASQLQFSLYGNVVPGNASTVHPANKSHPSWRSLVELFDL